MPEPDSFIRLAEKAVKAEQNQNWQKAAEFWGQAATLAQNGDNRHWAESRHAWCTARCLRPQMR